MAVISCPLCAKKISDKAQQCPHCEADLNMDSEARDKLARREVARKTQKISTQSLLAMMLLLAGFWFMYFQTPEADSVQMMLSQGTVAIGFCWYIVNRIRLILLKRLSK
ncbi:MAG: hypothetical protein ACI9FJ_003144 [Alteromonadaceae bacterium]|jgi:hypothetical protein